jgi:hypothetical protein
LNDGPLGAGTNCPPTHSRLGLIYYLLLSIIDGEMVACRARDCPALPRHQILAQCPSKSSARGRRANNAKRGAVGSVLHLVLLWGPPKGVVALVVLEPQPPGKRETSSILS